MTEPGVLQSRNINYPDWWIPRTHDRKWSFGLCLAPAGFCLVVLSDILTSFYPLPVIWILGRLWKIIMTLFNVHGNVCYYCSKVHFRKKTILSLNKLFLCTLGIWIPGYRLTTVRVQENTELTSQARVEPW